MWNNNTKLNRSAATIDGASTGLNATAGPSNSLPSRPDTVGWPTSTYYLVQYGNGDFEHDDSRDLGKRPNELHAKYHDKKMAQFCDWMPVDYPNIKDLAELTEATRQLASELGEESTVLEVSNHEFEPGHAGSDSYCLFDSPRQGQRVHCAIETLETVAGEGRPCSPNPRAGQDIQRYVKVLQVPTSGS